MQQEALQKEMWQRGVLEKSQKETLQGGHDRRNGEMRCGWEGASEKSQKETPREGNARAGIAKQDVAGRGIRGYWRKFKLKCCKEGSTTEKSRIKKWQGKSLIWRHHRWGIALGSVAWTCGLLAETPQFQF